MMRFFKNKKTKSNRSSKKTSLPNTVDELSSLDSEQLHEVVVKLDDEFSENSLTNNSVFNNLSIDLVDDSNNKLIVALKKDMSDVSSNFKELKDSKTPLEVSSIIPRLRLALKSLNKDVQEIKKQFDTVANKLIEGSFFSWEAFMKDLIDRVNTRVYVKQKDRATLREVALILSKEINQSIPDLDSHIRWLIYSIDPRLNVEEELSLLLQDKKHNFEYQKKQLEEEFLVLEKSIQDIQPSEVLKASKAISSLATKVRKISTGKKRFVKADLEKKADLFDDFEANH